MVTFRMSLSMALLLVPLATSAQSKLTASQLVQLCKAPATSAEYNSCGFYITGFLDGDIAGAMSTMTNYLALEKRQGTLTEKEWKDRTRDFEKNDAVYATFTSYCPKGVTVKQIAAETVISANTHPPSADQTANNYLLQVLNRTWPPAKCAAK